MSTVSDSIVRWNTPTKAGNTLGVFYNAENDLLVVDIVHANESGGNEIVRRRLDESALLAHCEGGA